MSAFGCCGLFGAHQPEGPEESVGFISDISQTSYCSVLDDLYEELDRKRAELERLRYLDSEDSEDCESLGWYGGPPDVTRGERRARGAVGQERPRRGQGDDSGAPTNGGPTKETANVNNNQIGASTGWSEGLLEEIPLNDDDSRPSLIKVRREKKVKERTFPPSATKK